MPDRPDGDFYDRRVFLSTGLSKEEAMAAYVALVQKLKGKS